MTVGLIYHDVVAEESVDEVGFPGPLARRYKHTPEQFERHLDAIARSGANVGLLGGPGPDPEVALTFDDGGLGALHVCERLEARGWRGHFFVVTGRIDTPGFLSAAQVRELVERGHLVGSHTHTHPMSMRSLSAVQLREEWTLSRARLTELLGAPPSVAAVPGGSLSDDVLGTACEAGYELLLTSQPLARARSRGAMRIRGRYTVWAHTPPETVAAYIRGDFRAGARAWVWWTTKVLAKRMAPGGYERLRRARTR